MKATIIITAQRDRGFLEQAMDSAVDQKFPQQKYEVILASDGNRDLSSYAKAYKIQFVTGEKANLATSANRAVKIAKGEYIKLLSDDDILVPNCLMALVNKADEEKADLVHAQAQYIRDGESTWVYIPRITHPTFEQLMAHNHIHGGTTLYRRKALLEVNGYNETLWTGEELDLHFKLLRKGYRIGYVPSVVMLYRRHSEQKSLGINANKIARTEVIKKIRRSHRYAVE